MPRYELIDDSSSKFWQIVVSGASFTTTHGRIGSAGVSKTKDFADKASAKEAADKLIVTKVKKGYEKVAAKKAVARKAAPKKAVARKVAQLGLMRFELVDGASSKFWEIETKQASYTVCYGRIGTNGQSKTKKLASASAAHEKQQNLIEEKVKKGYVLVDGGKPDKRLPKTAKGKAKKSTSKTTELKFQLSDYDHETDRHAEIEIDVNELQVNLKRINEANSSWEEYSKKKPKEWVTEKTILFVSGKALVKFVEMLLARFTEKCFCMWLDMDELDEDEALEHCQEVLGGIDPELSLSGKQRVGKVPSKTLAEWSSQ